jgi:uncharacterized protein (TIGR00369 family)
MENEQNPIVEMFRSLIGTKLEDGPPFTTWLGGTIVSCDVGEMEVEFEVRPEMANPTGLLHGGIQAAIIDDVIGMTSATLGEEGFMLTIDLHVNFLGRVKVGQMVKARARFVRLGRRIAHAVCELVDAEGNVVARGDSNLMKTGYKPDYQKKMDERKQ